MTELIALGVVVAGAVVALAWLADRRRCAVCNRPCPGTPANEEGRRVCPDCRRRVRPGCAAAGCPRRTRWEM